MPGLRRIPLVFSCVLIAALPLSAIARAKPAAAAEARNRASLAFQRDLVSVLAPRADALPLLGAALLARPLEHQPKYNDFHTLIERAVVAPGHGPAQSWVRLSDCDTQADACPNLDALAVLRVDDPDNAAVWLLQLGQDMRNGKSKAARADLTSAAAAKRYDDYTGTSLMALATTVSVLPPPPEALDPPAPGGAAGLQAMIVFGTGSAQPQPGMQAVAKLCEGAAGDVALVDDCLKLGKTLEWGSSPLARSLGLHLREVLDADPARQDDARRARRNLIWQVQNFARLAARVPADKTLAQHLLALARHGGTEMSLMLAALRDYGIPVDAPADWQPHEAD